MFQELKSDEFENVRSLFQGFNYSLSIHAAIEGNNPGRIFVDHVSHPRTALALTVEGYLLAGDDRNPETNAALRQFFKDRIFTGQVFVNGDESLSLAVHPETWEARLPELIPDYEVEKLERYQYLCRELKFDWRSHVPAGYTVRRVDRALLDGAQGFLSDEMRGWINVEEEWWTEDNFLSKGVAFAVLNEGAVVALCASDCVAGDRIDVGIITQRAHRRRGLATIAVAATVEHCLQRGFSAVGWHCNAINIASWKTAEKVGFERDCQYAYYYYVYDPIEHLAERGWYYYLRGEYARTIQYYEQVFALRDENPNNYYYEMASSYARLGEVENAIRFLQKAVDRGWSDFQWTRQQEEFRILHGMPEWGSVLARMERAARA